MQYTFAAAAAFNADLTAWDVTATTMCDGFGNEQGENPVALIEKGCVASPNTPRLLSLGGCASTTSGVDVLNNDTWSGTADCPTAGGSRVTVVGANLVDSTVAVHCKKSVGVAWRSLWSCLCCR